MEVLRSKGAGTTVDVDHACLCETIDTIGLYGFRHNFDALGCDQVTSPLRTPWPESQPPSGANR